MSESLLYTYCESSCAAKYNDEHHTCMCGNAASRAPPPGQDFFHPLACDDCNPRNDLFMCTFEGCGKVGSHQRAAVTHRLAAHTVDTFGKVSKDELCGAERVRRFIEGGEWGAEVKCNHCHITFHDESDVQAHHHMVKVRGGFKCAACYHTRMKIGRHKCSFRRAKCPMGCVLPFFSTRQATQLHFDKHHPPVKSCACLRPQCDERRAYKSDGQVKVRNDLVVTLATEYSLLEPAHGLWFRFHNAWATTRATPRVPRLLLPRDGEIGFADLVGQCAARGMAVPDALYSTYQCRHFHQGLKSAVAYLFNGTNETPAHDLTAILPAELVRKVMAHLDPVSAASFGATSSRLRSIYADVARQDRFRTSKFVYRKLKNHPFLNCHALFDSQEFYASSLAKVFPASQCPSGKWYFHTNAFADALLRHYTFDDIIFKWPHQVYSQQFYY